MGTYLNIGMMQSGDCSSSFEYNLKRIKKETRSLMMGMNAPELIVGIELGIGTYWAEVRRTQKHTAGWTPENALCIFPRKNLPNGAKLPVKSVNFAKRVRLPLQNFSLG